ncbi:MAG: transposase [Actinobacteria bacterium]|nr:transposase [Actinomycetota bacterium]
MADLRRAPGRPMVHDLRAMLDGIGYVVRNGIEWRALPADFPPWEAVYAFFQRWNQRGLPHQLTDRLRARLRLGLGRDTQPSAAIVDSQSVKGAEWAGASTRGFDSGKKINAHRSSCLGHTPASSTDGVCALDRLGVDHPGRGHRASLRPTVACR